MTIKAMYSWNFELFLFLWIHFTFLFEHDFLEIQLHTFIFCTFAHTLFKCFKHKFGSRVSGISFWPKHPINDNTQIIANKLP